jgi:putative zinc finger protein
MDGETTPVSDSSSAGSPWCERVDERMSELLAGDLPIATRRELEQHVRHCARCRPEFDAAQQLIVRLRALPTTASSAAVWRSIELGLAREPARRPYAFALNVGALIAAGVVVAATLVLRNDAVVALLESRLPDRLRESLLSGALRSCLLPTLFTLSGAIASLLALPLLAGREREPLLVPVAESESAS